MPDGSYNISEIQDYIEYIIKKHETIGENAPILIYANTINNRIVFKIKSRYKLELLSKETMKLLGSTKDIKNYEYRFFTNRNMVYGSKQ